MSDQPVKKPRLRVVDMPTTSSTRRPTRSVSKPSKDQEFGSRGGGGGRRKKKDEKDFERQTVAVRMTPERKLWDEATSGITSIHGRPFDPARRYGEQDIVLHKKLGLGIVQDVAKDEASMNVLFRDGVEKLELTSSEG